MNGINTLAGGSKVIEGVFSVANRVKYLAKMNRKSSPKSLRCHLPAEPVGKTAFAVDDKPSYWKTNDLFYCYVCFPYLLNLKGTKVFRPIDGGMFCATDFGTTSWIVKLMEFSEENDGEEIKEVHARYVASYVTPESFFKIL
jgi:hypothetical protein